jgi:hypothetical protein
MDGLCRLRGRREMFDKFRELQHAPITSSLRFHGRERGVLGDRLRRLAELETLFAKITT